MDTDNRRDNITMAMDHIYGIGLLNRLTAVICYTYTIGGKRIMTKIPKDLEELGGWEFNEPFMDSTLIHGQIWRKCGPVDAIKIKAVMLPGCPEYDNGLKGISVYFSIFPSNSKSVSWAKDSSFIPGDHRRIMEYFERNGYALAGVKTDECT